MEWKKIYRDKLTTPTEAVRRIKSGDFVYLAPSVAEPVDTVRALLGRRDELEDVTLPHMLTFGPSEYVREGMEKHFRYYTFFAADPTREAINEGRAQFIPANFSQVPSLFSSGRLGPVDVAIFSFTPPDKHGYCYIGPTVSYLPVILERAKLVIGEVNGRMPRVRGETMFHVSRIDSLVECSHEMPTMTPPVPGETELEIGRLVGSLIEDESTIQVGIGAIPEAVVNVLRDKKDLGIHSELVSDGLMRLAREGIVTGLKKRIDQGKIVCTFMAGTKEFYEFIDDNPIIHMYPVSYTNDVRVIARNEKQVSINSFLQIDLLGQVNAETLGTRQYSGVGGSQDFTRGAQMSRGGKAILARNSTTKGKYSCVVPLLERGTPVSIPRTEVQYVITEYGIADLKGKTLRERAQALIDISHPEFRKELQKEAQILFRVFDD